MRLKVKRPLSESCPLLESTQGRAPFGGPETCLPPGINRGDVVSLTRVRSEVCNMAKIEMPVNNFFQVFLVGLALGTGTESVMKFIASLAL